MSSATIRRARPGEADRLSELALRSKAYWGYPPDFIEACWEELTLSEADLRATPTFVAAVDGERVGFYALERLSVDEVELGFLFVEPAAIGRGHGRALIEHAKEQARALGYRTLVIQGDPHAEDFYRAAGGRRVGEKASLSVPGRMLPLFNVDLGGG